VSIHTDGNWNPDDRSVYFLATTDRVQQEMACRELNHPYALIAVNDISDGVLPWIEELIEDGVHVMIDSGVFWLTNKHKRAHHMTMNQALRLPPEEIDGFDWLLERYRVIHRALGQSVWGYVELDQGGLDNKRRTRAMLEDEGINPMPVYHPLNDGWEYFDELAHGYDRICFGNIVQANRQVRLRLLATLFERHRRHPDLYVHMLGFTPNQYLAAYPWDSADSSSWLSSVRWAGVIPRAMGKGLGPMDPAYQYRMEERAKEGRNPQYMKNVALGAVDLSFAIRSLADWRANVNAQLELDRYPDLLPNEVLEPLR